MLARVHFVGPYILTYPEGSVSDSHLFFVGDCFSNYL